MGCLGPIAARQRRRRHNLVQPRDEQVGSGTFGVGPPGVGFIGQKWPADQRQAGRRDRAGRCWLPRGKPAICLRQVLPKRIEVQPVQDQHVAGVIVQDPVGTEDAAEATRQH